MKITFSPQIYQSHPNQVRGALIFAAITGPALIVLGAFAVHTGSLGLLKTNHGIGLIVGGSLMTITALFLLFVLKRYRFAHFINKAGAHTTLGFGSNGAGYTHIKKFNHFKNMIISYPDWIMHKHLIDEMENEADGNDVSFETMVNVLARHETPHKSREEWEKAFLSR